MMKCLIMFLTTASLVTGLQLRGDEVKQRMLEHRRTKKSPARNLVVGGTTIDQTRYPYYTLVETEYTEDFFFCGGSLIHPDVVVTTAGCIGDGAISISVAVNYTTDEIQTGFERFRDVVRYDFHPQYNSDTSANDLALLHLTSPVEGITPVPIRPSRVGNGVDMTVIGFGLESESAEEFPVILREAVVSSIAPNFCNREESYNGTILGQRMICAAGDGTDSCDGDGGGPLIIKGATETDDELVGAVSFGNGCADPLFPGIYTRLGFFVPYIEEQICLFSQVRPFECPSLAPSSTPTATAVPTGPTASPAPSISSAPSMQPTRKKGGSKFCFSGENTVVTEDGVVRMDDLQLGDRIKSGDDNFEEIYSFGHYSDELESEYLQLFTEGNKQPLELSADHMVFLQNNVAVAASDVNVGDNLLLADGEISTVKSIKAITRKGMYAPFTDSGTVAVNGIKASSFVAFQGDGFQTPFSDHFAAHMSQTPQRILARLGFSCKSFTEEGVNSCLVLPMKMHQWFKSLPPFALVFLLTPFITLLFALYTVEQYPRTFLAIGALAFLYRKLVVRVTKVKQM